MFSAFLNLFPRNSDSWVLAKQIGDVRHAAEQAILYAESMSSLEDARIRYLGVNGELRTLMMRIGHRGSAAQRSLTNARFLSARRWLSGLLESQRESILAERRRQK